MNSSGLVNVSCLPLQFNEDRQSLQNLRVLIPPLPGFFLHHFSLFPSPSPLLLLEMFHSFSLLMSDISTVRVPPGISGQMDAVLMSNMFEEFAADIYGYQADR